jgi:hypothetical protein
VWVQVRARTLSPAAAADHQKGRYINPFTAALNLLLSVGAGSPAKKQRAPQHHADSNSHSNEVHTDIAATSEDARTASSNSGGGGDVTFGSHDKREIEEERSWDVTGASASAQLSFGQFFLI